MPAAALAPSTHGRRLTTSGSALTLARAAAEQDWNTRQLATPVTAPRVRVWTYPAPGVVFGCAQAALHEEAARAARTDCELVQRRAGGGAVLTGPWMLSSSVVLPPDHRLLAGGTVSSYRWLGVLHAGLLRDFGMPAHALAPDELARRPGDPALGWACFGGLSPWEVIADGRKLVGLAQLRRQHGVLLTTGTLLYRPEWSLLCDALGRPADDIARLDAATTSCAELLGTAMHIETLADGLQQMLADVLGELEEDDRA
ncbi:biotin/lipoate A/B protein ligase family protein [Azoarcus olearius]|uniref:Lipoate protein ligase n=1 Tax=Azoarcus sp. (strain BH72) TaxID=418699 RepID=A1KCD1_AZOSB|nr:lipoate--protein ligase [Azoarcus olearius]CAL96487.1 putative lipoate protein ligase [Azoarcus olearius]